jgi:2-methylaconitate cis-trans-isomerase PrpF
MIGKKMAWVVGVGVAFGLVAAISVNASAADRWQQSHPRRVEVNHRLGNLNNRISQERRDGQISRAQAWREHREVHQIRMEERAMARKDGTHLTRPDQHSLNQQENVVSAQVGK